MVESSGSRVARMLRGHWPNIRTFFTHRITNAGAESMNSKIQKIASSAKSVGSVGLR
jgi:transposase